MRYVFLILLVLFFNGSLASAAEISGVAVEGLFYVPVCKSDEIAPGTTLFRPHESKSTLVFHLRGCELQRITVLKGHTNVIRLKRDGSMIGIAEERPFDIDGQGRDSFSRADKAGNILWKWSVNENLLGRSPFILQLSTRRLL